MLQIKQVTKIYQTGELTQHALADISVNFRENEFVSILGQSGSGKTTLLNIIGGLDRYTSGDLKINGISTKKYKDADWDVYRNDAIGFVFQSYNLIPHQSVLANVELALTLAGVSKTQRRNQAIKVLTQVGLEAHLHKKPNQMSGGQMQRVAIARALVNNPDILLADEPTGALDSETSVQIMALLKEIAKDKLVIMVTHNPELAQEYSTRIIKLLDGHIVSDSHPYEVSDAMVMDKKSDKKISMSYATALSLSFNNLKTKKGRTFLTAFAGSIGIIGIALILSLSSGTQSYIKSIEQDTLSTYPITIQSQTINMMDPASQRGPFRQNDEAHDVDQDRIYQGGYALDLLKRTTIQMQNNDLGAFKTYLESVEGADMVAQTSAIQYGYDLDLQIYLADTTNGVTQVNPSPLLQSDEPAMLDTLRSSVGVSTDIWSELIGNDEMLHSQYEVLAGKWPTSKEELLVVVDENNEISDTTLYALGLKPSSEYEEMAKAVKDGEEIDKTAYEAVSFSYDEIMNMKFKLVLPTDYYVLEDDKWLDLKEDEVFVKNKVDQGMTMKVVGIVRPSDEANAASIGSTIAYRSSLTEYVMAAIDATDIVQDQKNNPTVDVFSGKEFGSEEDTAMDPGQMMALMSPQQQAYFATLSSSERAAFIAQYSPTSPATYEENISKLGVVDASKPSSIGLYLANFNARDEVIAMISQYNEDQVDAGHENLVIAYTDLVGMMMSSITQIIDMITYILIGFVSISLIVSSIMIGIITYISVLERTKEIGILRSIGASKKDVSSVFNAETMIIGLVSGALGILITLLLNIPINAIIYELSGVNSIASLPINGAIGLVVISVLLSVIAGLIPSRMAAKRDPVEALRME